mgnify:CR=1 FL=1
MQMNSSQFGQTLALPDTWQRKALNFLREGRDVVLHAPTGAGKTFVFEQLIESGWKGKAIYTVPTRALANDKFRDWKERGWDVGLVTGDVRYRSDAHIVVATLETQRGSMSRGIGPDLLVVDEYQLLGDQRRGPGYEVTIALAPLHTRLLLLSGSVGNPLEVADWLQAHGRSVELVSEGKRPVPLDEVFAETLLRRPFRGRKIRGHWPKLVAGALNANLGPLLIFAPRRAIAEDLARQLAVELPQVEPLELSPEQKKVSGKELTSLLKRRVAYHHSGLDYLKRAGVVEPLAAAGRVRLLVNRAQFPALHQKVVSTFKSPGGPTHGNQLGHRRHRARVRRSVPQLPRHPRAALPRASLRQPLGAPQPRPPTAAGPW